MPTPPPDQPIEDNRALTAFFAASAVDKQHRLIATTGEAFPYRLSTYAPVGYHESKGLRDFLAALCEHEGSPVIEDNFIVGAQLGNAVLTLQSGGRIRIAGSPLPNLHDTAQELGTILTEINRLATPLDIGFAGIGFHPTAGLAEIADVPGARFRLMRDAMSRRHSRGLDILQRSCSAQISLNYTDEADMVRKFRIASMLQPVAAALFAVSPFAESDLSPFQSPRMQARLQVEDADKNPLLPLIFEEGFGFERYTEWAIDQPLLYVERAGQFYDAAGQSFRDFMAGKLSCLPGQRPFFADWQRHLENLVAETGLTPNLTLSGADAGPAEMTEALAGYWTGILYDERATNDALELIKDWSYGDLAQFRVDAPRLGFNAEIRGYKASDLAHTTLTFAIQGLRRRAIRLNGGPDESRYPQVMFDYTEGYQTRSSQFRMESERFGKFSLHKVFDICRLLPPSEAGGAEGIDFA
ncbi:MAG: glutamate-cysteine ligase family protein [Alphaproteobacteria bacterium]|nr:glutamate-cysteine ligase family protein [Alphaproteobacteria bacterium]